jgi:hypothetical protein
MNPLEVLRSRLRASKIPAAGQSPREFLPEGSLEGLLSHAEVTLVLADNAFRTPLINSKALPK